MSFFEKITRIILEFRGRSYKVCCSGYKKLGNKCVPSCQATCENADCTGPNTCTCREGYKKLSSFRCIPACDSCENGLCVAPNICNCYEGFKKTDNETGICEPHCSKGCEGGECESPDVCRCPAYHDLIEIDERNVCQPHCATECFNGRCVAPDTCECLEGYQQLDSNRWTLNWYYFKICTKRAFMLLFWQKKICYFIIESRKCLKEKIKKQKLGLILFWRVIG